MDNGSQDQLPICADTPKAIPLAGFTTPEGDAVEAITVSGRTVFWMMSSDPAAEFADEIPAHEGLGKLPQEFRARLGYQCPAIAKATRKQCKNIVTSAGELCARHRGNP